MSVKFDSDNHDKSIQYMGNWFWSIETLSQASSIPTQSLSLMFQAGCAPGAIYAYDPSSGWWSALAAYMKKAPPSPKPSARIWYSPASVWWLRRSMLLINSGLTVLEAAEVNRNHFEKEFVSLLSKIYASDIAYPNCFNSSGTVDNTMGIETANSEWRAWISGAYGVCLRDFTASTCIRKEAIATLVRLHIEDPEKYFLTDIDLVDLCQELSSLVTPFSPWERPVGTPGKTIDVILKRFNLGCDFPYPISNPAEIF